MYPLYKDIRSRLGVPKWIDGKGVPRYDDFTPEDAAEIYGDWVALMAVECQACQKTFQCATSISMAHLVINRQFEAADYPGTPAQAVPILADWGDAPWHTFEGDETSFEGQCSGTTMSTDFTELRVWHKDKQSWEWVEVENPMQYLQTDATPVKPLTTEVPPLSTDGSKK